MRRRTIELCVGLGLLLGPLGYALTLEPEVIEVVEVVEVAQAPAPSIDPVMVEWVEAPATEPAPVEPQAEAEAEAAPNLEGRLSFAFVNQAGMVLSTTAERTWGSGRLRAHAGPGEFRAAKRADLAKIPADLLAQRGHTFDVYGASGKVCTARLGELSILAQHNGPSEIELFHGNMDFIDEEEDGSDPFEKLEQEEHTPRQIRAKVWSFAETGWTPPSADEEDHDDRWLVAPLVSETSCEGGLWARDAELPPPTVLHLVEEASPITAQRVAVHQASAALAEAKLSYERELADAPEDESLTDWATLVRDYPVSVKAWHDETGAPRLTELEFGYEPEGCGEGGPHLASVDMVVGSSFESLELEIHPLAVFDADLDGRFELLYGSSLSSETDGLGQSWSIYEEFYCPC